MATKNAPTTLREAVLFFANYENCHRAIVAIRWPDGVVRCPTCGSDGVAYLANQRRWKCYAKHPRQQFSLKVGTIFEDSPLGLEKWLPALWLLTNCKNGISSYELGRALGVTQKTAWFMLSRLRLALQDEHDGGQLSGEVEADETYIGGLARNMHAGKRERVNMKRGRSLAGKTAVMALLQRHGANSGVSQVRTEVLSGLKRGYVQKHVRRHVEIGSTLHTDAFASYTGLDREFVHNVIDHAECYVKGNVHTNGCENFWSLLKRAIRGTYVSIEPFHLFRYLDEECFRFNKRDGDDASRFVQALKGIINRRLTYKVLIGSELPQTC